MSATGESDDWASEEFGTAALGDARLTQRLVALARRLAQSPQCSFPQSLDGAQLKAAYRFFDNPRIDTDGVLVNHIGQTLNRMQQVPVVLAPQDTTEFNLMHLPATQGLGHGTSSNLHGFMLHSLLAVTPEGLPLGVLGMKTWIRAPEESGKSKQRRKRPIEEKESVKWLEGLEHLASLKTRCPDTHIIGICDRDGDVYDAFIAPRPAGVDWLVRAAWSRRVAHPQAYLWDAVAAEPAVGETDLLVPTRNGKAPTRTAQLTVRCKALRLHPPRSRQREKLPDVDVYVIHALETRPPEGVEPIEWMLLSSVPTLTCEDALERLAWYARRWTIESWHRVLKSGCQIEARQFGHLDRFVRATALFAVISWRIMYATLLARLDVDRNKYVTSSQLNLSIRLKAAPAARKTTRIQQVVGRELKVSPPHGA
ncbi:Transposase DNA-binding [Burkholderia sp. D7]|nr:Transposase DNA-binding [Burkholderia sp. D7]